MEQAGKPVFFFCFFFGATISLRLSYYTAAQGKRILKVLILTTDNLKFLLMLVLGK